MLFIFRYDNGIAMFTKESLSFRDTNYQRPPAKDHQGHMQS